MRFRHLAQSAVIAVVFLARTGLAQTPSGIHQEIQQTYSFQPHTLNQKQIKEKSVLLDKFWSKAKSQRDIYLPALRRELGDFSNSAFFLFDGSMLLLNLSESPTDRKIALAAIAHCDLRDVQSAEYVRQVNRLAALNEDTTAAAFHILGTPDFRAFIPQHVLTLGQNYSLIYMLFPADSNHWLQPAISRLQTEPDATAQQSLLLLLWYAQTSPADQAISAFSADAQRPAASREYAKQLIGRSKPALMTQILSTLSGEEPLRQQRRETMRRISDEALIEFDEQTSKLIAKRSR